MLRLYKIEGFKDLFDGLDEFRCYEEIGLESHNREQAIDALDNFPVFRLAIIAYVRNVAYVKNTT